MFYSSYRLPDWSKQRQISQTRAVIPACLVEHMHNRGCLVGLNNHTTPIINKTRKYSDGLTNRAMDWMIAPSLLVG